MYYKENNKKDSVVTTIRIDYELKKMSEDYAKKFNDFTLSSFVNEQLKQFFINKKSVKNRINSLKIMLENEKRLLKKLENKQPKFKKSELKDFYNGKSPKEVKFWKETIKILDSDPSFLDGRYNYYRYNYNNTITKKDFVINCNIAKQINEQ